MDIAHQSESRHDFAPIVVFSLTLFTSATLMFVLQPLFGKLLLPSLGGSASVWNTCMVFYQSILFFGYLYAHYLTTKFSRPQQVKIHLSLLLLCLIFIPVSLQSNSLPPTDRAPIFWLLSVLLLSIGLPFFILSTTSPLLQKWFSSLNHQFSADPYFLSIASNTGSLLALISYPFIIESHFSLSLQQQYWSTGFILLLILIFFCALWLPHQKITEISSQKQNNIKTSLQAPDLKQKLYWLILSFVPSSLLISTTHYIGTDIASVPLLWVIPLAIYLLSFIIVFSKYNDKSHAWFSLIQPWIVAPFLIYFFSNEKLADYTLELSLHLLVFFTSIMVCHGELAKRRPHPDFLTDYYLIMSFGGMLGGIFNTFVFPFVFNDLHEYPLLLISALLLNPRNTKLGIVLKGYQSRLALLIYFVFFATVFYINRSFLMNDLGIIAIVIIAVSNYFIFKKNIVYLILYSTVIASCTAFNAENEQTLMQERNFYGVLSVNQSVLKDNKEGRNNIIMHTMYSGTTRHGSQLMNDDHFCRPISYYGEQGPIGQLFTAFDPHNSDWQVGIVGLGSGALGGYAKRTQNWHFYELNPMVIDMAENPEYFSYLHNCVEQYVIYPGDARLTLDRQTPLKLDLLVIDAFTSDSIPTHLLTREAMELYLERTGPDGIIAMHISNHYLSLKQVLADHARHLGLYALIQEYRPANKNSLTYASDWVVLTKNPENLAPLLTADNQNWQKLEANDAFQQSWTDNFTSLISVWKL